MKRIAHYAGASRNEHSPDVEVIRTEYDLYFLSVREPGKLGFHSISIPEHELKLFALQILVGTHAVGGPFELPTAPCPGHDPFASSYVPKAVVWNGEPLTPDQLEALDRAEGVATLEPPVEAPIRT